MQIHRYSSNIIKELLLQFPAVLVLGARQVGKTTLCAEIAKDWTTVDLEAGSEIQHLRRDPAFFFSQHPSHVFIDEAQIFPDLFPALRVVIDRQRTERGRFLLTGSSSPELMGQVSESLAGRVGVFELPALKASERFGRPLSPFYSLLKNKEDSKAYLKVESDLTYAELEQSFLEGGFPEVSLLGSDEKRLRWFQSYVATYIERDIRRLFPRLNIESYKLFVSMLAQLNGKLVNMSDIARSLGVTQPTVREYLEIAHGSFVWRRVNTFSRNVMRRIVKMPKGLYRDSGLSNFLLFLHYLPQLRSSPLVGWLWEAFIIEEVLKGCALGEVLVEPYFYRTSDGREIDLILEGSFGLLPIEIKYGLAVTDQDLRTLKLFMKENKLNLGLVVSNIEKPRIIGEGIIELPTRLL